jgi:hypothetical protein
MVTEQASAGVTGKADKVAATRNAFIKNHSSLQVTLRLGLLERYARKDEQHQRDRPDPFFSP